MISGQACNSSLTSYIQLVATKSLRKLPRSLSLSISLPPPPNKIVSVSSLLCLSPPFTALTASSQLPFFFRLPQSLPWFTWIPPLPSSLSPMAERGSYGLSPRLGQISFSAFAFALVKCFEFHRLDLKISFRIWFCFRGKVWKWFEEHWDLSFFFFAENLISKPLVMLAMNCIVPFLISLK